MLSSRELRWRYVFLPIAACCVAIDPAFCQAAPSRAIAGTSVANTAYATVSLAGGSVEATSNTATIRIDELLDIGLSSETDAVAVRPGARGIAFALENRGNGNEAFTLGATLDQLPASLLGFAIDIDGDGAFDAAVDRRLSEDVTVPLAPGQSLPMLVLFRADAAGEGNVTIAAAAVSGSGTPGTSYPGIGDGGYFAVVGATTAAATLPFRVAISDLLADVPIALLKSQQVTAPDGSDAPVPGATVTYTIAADFAGTSLVRGARFADPIPAGTEYVPGSLRIDGAALTDGVDADPGGFDGTAVTIALGDVSAPATRVIQFQVIIK